MKYTAAALAVAGLAAAQNMTTGNASDYTTGLMAALTAANLTSLATVITLAPEVGQMLASAGNTTVFAPSNAALAPLLANPAAAASLNITQVLSYHVVPGNVNIAGLGNGTNHTILQTALMAPLLGANETQVLVASIGVDGQPRLRQTAKNVTVIGNGTYQNLQIEVIDSVLEIPSGLVATATAANLSSLAGALTMVSPDLPSMLGNMSRVTIFAPINSAFAAIASTVATLNTSTIANVLLNHVINGTVVYSPEISANSTLVTAAGETMTFSIMNGTVMVSVGNATAPVIRTDIPIENGVVHLIGSVLANTMSNPEAAASAASSYAMEATSAPSATAGIPGAAAAGKTGAGYKTMAAGTTLAAVVAGAVFALVA